MGFRHLINLKCYIMMSLHGNTFLNTGVLWRESLGFHSQRAIFTKLWCFVISLKNLLNKQFMVIQNPCFSCDKLQIKLSAISMQRFYESWQIRSRMWQLYILNVNNTCQQMGNCHRITQYIFYANTFCKLYHVQILYSQTHGIGTHGYPNVKRITE